MNYLVEGAAVGVLALPLVRLTQVGYDRQLWRGWNQVDLMPFASPLTIRTPLWAWYLLFWAASLYTLVMAAANGSAAIIATVVGGLEGGYALLNGGRKQAPVDLSFPSSVLAFGLWHNALMEELLFRGAPLLLGAATGLSTRTFWPYIYVPVTALAFGLYHLGSGRRIRFYDTTILGALLGMVALRYGLLAAVLVHSIHNALSIPLGQLDPTLRTWRRNRRLYLVGLSLIALLRLAVSGPYAPESSGVIRHHVVRQSTPRGGAPDSRASAAC